MVSPSKNIPSTHLTEAPESQSSSRLLEHDSTLTAGQSVFLTLGSDSLVVVGMAPPSPQLFVVFGLLDVRD